MSNTPKEKSFQQTLVERANREKLPLVTTLIELATKGDKTAIGVLDRALQMEMTPEGEEIFPIAEEQFNQIILIKAKRINGELATIEPEPVGEPATADAGIQPAF